MTDKALQPVEQKTVVFYEDEVTAVRMAGGEVFVPIRPIVDGLGIDWSSQRQRINRDPILSVESRPCEVVTTTQGQPDQRREMLCLPLDYISGFLFGVNANRVKPGIRDRLIRYQRECYKVLADAFQAGRLTAEPTFADLLAQDTPEARAVHMARAIVQMAENQLILRSQIDAHDQRLEEHETRLETIETQLGDPGRHITPAQAASLSQAVKAVAMALSNISKRNEYGGVYGEMYRRYEIPSYRELPAEKFEDAMNWLNEWLQSLTGESF